jgi:hypothetical protein
MTSAGFTGDITMMNKRKVLGTCLVSLLLISEFATAVTPAPNSEGPAGRAHASVAPTTSSAPWTGVITSIDLTKDQIGINSQSLEIKVGLVALLDKRQHSDGLLDLKSLEPGMQVRYRTEELAGTRRVVELWVLRNPGKGKPK